MPSTELSYTKELILIAEAKEVVFGTLPEHGLDMMTPDGVEFVLCASALTAQM